MITEEVINAIDRPKSIPTSFDWENQGPATSARLPLLVEGIGLEGFFARIKFVNSVDAFGSLVQLEFDAFRKTNSLARLEWKVGHTNPNKGPLELRLLTMDSTHFHGFSMNYIQNENRMMKRNLPIAAPVEPDPETLEEFLEICEDRLMINGLARIVRPPFQSSLF